MIEPVLHIIYPFYPLSPGFKTGRDPLGVQSHSISLYSRLLPGMTNQTQRIRYYGFYCWLLKEYDSISGEIQEKSIEHQKNFIRRGELLLAFIMGANFKEQGVVGSLHVNKKLPFLLNNEPFDLNIGAKEYWDYSTGAFGQYYSSTLEGLNLITTSHNFFVIKSLGLELATAYEANLNEEVKKSFLHTVQEEKFILEDLEFLKSFCLSHIPLKSQEWIFYKKLLISDDSEALKSADGSLSTNRKETINLYIKYLKNKIPKQTFTEFVFQNFNNKVPVNSAVFGWYCYYLNECTHFALETIFWALLDSLDGRILPFQYFIEERVNIILITNCQSKGLSEIQQLQDHILEGGNQDLVSSVRELESLTKSSSNTIEALGKAIEMLSLIYLTTEPYRGKIMQFEQLNFLSNQSGNLTSILHKYVNIYLQSSYSDYVGNLLRTLLNDHIATAYRKMTYTGENLLKFIIEDNIISHIQTVHPTHTNPRLGSLNSFLHDLSVLKQNTFSNPEADQLLTVS